MPSKLRNRLIHKMAAISIVPYLTIGLPTNFDEQRP